MQQSHVPDGNVFADFGGQPLLPRTVACHVDNRAVLDVTARADTDGIDIAANDTAVPNRGLFADLDIPDDGGIVRDKGAGVDLGADAIKGQEYRHAASGSRKLLTVDDLKRRGGMALLK